MAASKEEEEGGGGGGEGEGGGGGGGGGGRGGGEGLLQLSSSSMDMASCSTAQSRIKADPEQAPLKCPRCHSFNTKFCYYNNYSFTQPRHFCKSCKRYWTEGGALRNVPVGGGCRKNKRASSQSSSPSKASVSQRGDPAPSPDMASAGYGGVEGDESGRFALAEEQDLKRRRTERQGITHELGSPPLLSQLHGLPPLDSSLHDFCLLPSRVLKGADPSFVSHSDDGLSETLAQSTPNIGRISHVDGIVLSGAEPNFVNLTNSGFGSRMQNAEHHDHKQQQKSHGAIPADQALVDEKAWRHLAGDVSAEAIIDHMRENVFLSGSQKLPYDCKDVPFDWKIGSEGFDPTNDLSYMGGPEFWSDIPIFDAGSGTVI